MRIWGEEQVNRMGSIFGGLNSIHRWGGADFAGQENDGQRNFKGWKLQDWKMMDKSAGLENDGQICRGSKMQDWKLTDKSSAGKNVKHVVLTFRNHHTKLINVHDFGVSVSSSQSSCC